MNRRFLRAAPQNYVFLAVKTGPTDYNGDASLTRTLEGQRRALTEQRDNLMLEIAELEVALNITRRWQPSDAAYAETNQYIATRKYRLALAKLQGLVIQRLFELQKMNLAQTGKALETSFDSDIT